VSQKELNAMYREYLLAANREARASKIAVDDVLDKVSFDDWLTDETFNMPKVVQKKLHVVHTSTTCVGFRGDTDTYYYFDDGSAVVIKYCAEFDESQPAGGCSTAQFRAIEAYLDSIVSRGGK
jgi:hypothetical protein